MGFGLLSRDLPSIHQVLNQLMVGGDLAQGTVAKQVSPRVAYVDHRELMFGSQDCGAGGAKTPELLILFATLNQLIVRAL